MLLVLTYRDELGRDHPLTPLLGDLGHHGDVLRLPLRRLTPAGVAELAAGGTLDPRRVYTLTDGNPYLVTELIESTSQDGSAPVSVVDGVLGRLRALPEPTQDVIEQLAVLPAAVPRPLLDALNPGAWHLLDEAEARGLVTVSGGAVAFRHELTRRAIVDTLPGGRRAGLNRTALAALENQPRPDPGRLVHHAIEAGDDDAVVRHGPRAADQASASGAHAEATSHYRTLLGYEERFDTAERARLWQAYAIELYTVGDSDHCVAAGERAVALHGELGEPAGLARSLRWQSRLLWLAGRPAEARAAAELATASAHRSGEESVLAMALSNESQLAMLRDDHDLALPLAEQAISIARHTGERAVLSHALTNQGSTLFKLHGDDPAARAALQEAIDVAVGIDDHEDACRAYTNLGWNLLELGELDAAEPFARAGLDHADRAEFIMFWQYLSGLLARIALARGRWDEALALVDRVSPDVLPVRCTQQLVRATVAVRRGDADAEALLADAWELATRIDELQRIVPVACAAIEFTALTGTEPMLDAASVHDSTIGIAYSLQTEELSWRLGAVVATDAGRRRVPGSPYSLLADGQWRAAADAWQRLGWPYQRAEALAASPSVDDQLDALEILDQLGAAPLAHRVRERLRGLGTVRVPRGRSESARKDPSGLTTRQQAVLALLAEGLTNAEIAQRLVVSVRTVDSHVAAILSKLDVPNRHEAAEFQRRRRSGTG